MSRVLSRRPALLSLILLSFMVGPSLGQDAILVTAGRRLIDAERKTIFFAMHPTGTLTRMVYNGAQPSGDGFILTYTFEFKGLFGENSSNMDFSFNDRGRFETVKTNSTTSFIEPFTAADLVIDFLKDALKEDLELKKDGALAKALNAADAKKALEALLSYKQTTLRVPAGGNAANGASDEELIKLIRGSESMDDKERKYWVDLLPRMTEGQRAELKKILVNERDSLAEIDRKYAQQQSTLGEARQETEKGYDLLAKGDRAAAITVLTRVIEKHPKYVDAYFIRGQAHQLGKDHRAAVADFSRVVERAPTSAAAYRWRASSHGNLGQYRSAYLDYARVVELSPRDVLACNNLAWLLATCPEARFRDGKEAVEYATKACELTGWKNPMYFDTLAAAYAEDGQFDKAVSWQEKALADPAEMEKAVGKEELEKARGRLQLFKERKPFRESR